MIKWSSPMFRNGTSSSSTFINDIDQVAINLQLHDHQYWLGWWVIHLGDISWKTSIVSLVDEEMIWAWAQAWSSLGRDINDEEIKHQEVDHPYKWCWWGDWSPIIIVDDDRLGGTRKEEGGGTIGWGEEDGREGGGGLLKHDVSFWCTSKV